MPLGMTLIELRKRIDTEISASCGHCGNHIENQGPIVERPDGTFLKRAKAGTLCLCTLEALGIYLPIGTKTRLKTAL
jgi:hypothetical protein